MSCPILALHIDICQYRRVSKSRVLTLSPVQAVACCSPLSREPLSEMAAERIAPLLKALADPVRLRLMSLIASHEGGEACVCDLNDAFDLSQPTISQHLKVLHAAGLLEREKRGVWVYYRASAAAMNGLATLISATTTG
jgi:ArsR family transcriptional regulator